MSMVYVIEYTNGDWDWGYTTAIFASENKDVALNYMEELKFRSQIDHPETYKCYEFELSRKTLIKEKDNRELLSNTK